MTLEERAKVFQQAMESCKSSNPMDCIEWFADKILELEQKLEQTEKDLTDYQFNYPKIKDLEKENAELRYQLNKNPCVCKTEWHCNDCLELLNRAKRIIQSFVWWHTGEDRGSIDSNDLVERAEQFLKE